MVGHVPAIAVSTDVCPVHSSPRCSRYASLHWIVQNAELKLGPAVFAFPRGPWLWYAKQTLIHLSRVDAHIHIDTDTHRHQNVYWCIPSTKYLRTTWWCAQHVNTWLDLGCVVQSKTSSQTYPLALWAFPDDCLFFCTLHESLSLPSTHPLSLCAKCSSFFIP